jgi:hypothetical protein
MANPTAVVEAFSIQHPQICDGTSTFLTSLASAAAVGLDIYGVSDASLAADTGNFENPGDDKTLSRWNWINFATVTVQGGYLSFPLYSSLSGQGFATTTIAAATEVQSLASSGASAGTFRLSYRGEQTAPLTFSATNSVIQTALEGLSTIGVGNVTVTGGPANTTAVVITFSGTLASSAVDLVVVDKTSLTGGATAAVTRTTTGSPASLNFGIDLWHQDSMNVAPKPMILSLPSKDSNGLVRRLIIGLYKVQFGPIGFDGPANKDGLKVNYDGTALMSATDEVGVAFADGKSRIGRLLSIAQ